MSLTLPESKLPLSLTLPQAVEAAYPEALSTTLSALQRGLPVLIECDKGLTPYLYKCLRERLRKIELASVYLDGRAEQQGPPMGVVQTMIAQLKNFVRGAVDQRVAVLPHLDLLTTSSGGLTGEAREVIPLLYENPQLLYLGFRDPSFGIPKVIENLFPHRISIIGTPRDRLQHIVTQRDARKLAAKDQFSPYALYKYVSGVNAIRLRRVLEAIDGEDYPVDARPAWNQLRSSTLRTELTLPDLSLQKDIGGYGPIKDRIQRDIIDLVLRKDQLESADAVERLEKLIPRGIIFWGPPGTGKTLFAKAMASALGAAVQIISGPELKSRWVGESEANLRRVFIQARQSAPSLIVFDELDAFAAARGSFTGSGVEHSMVNQLLTEMDGFRDNEMVFVVGTTNFVESLDPALLRPGRFELHLEIPYPNASDRRAILDIYSQKLKLNLSSEALDYAVKQTNSPVETGGLYTGDHLNALARTVARRRLRDNIQTPTYIADIEAALTENLDRPQLSPEERRVVASHEAGHAMVALMSQHTPPIERISIRGDLPGALGFVRYADSHRRYVVSRGELLDAIAVLYGGREAELALVGDVSVGASHDLEQATQIARSVVEVYGMGPDDLVIRAVDAGRSGLSETTRSELDTAVHTILQQARAQAQDIICTHKESLEVLRDLLLEHEVLDRKAFQHLTPEARKHG